MIDYNHEPLGYANSKYSISYNELRENYIRICQMDDKEFVEKLPEVAHLACVIAWFKEIPSYICLCDEGIIHQIIHLIHLGYGKEKWANKIELKKIRNQFKKELKLN